MNGFLLIDKVPGISSSFVVAKVKRILRADKVGHLGTLDPFASGLLPIMIGGATRLADESIDGKKTYLFKVEFGRETDTLDPEGVVIDTKPVPEDFGHQIFEKMPQFLGKIEQIPPAYSALKVQGKPLYEYMRTGKALPIDIESKRRIVDIYSLDLISIEVVDDSCFATLRTTCGKGTYIRSLARDLAYAIGTVGHCVELRREFVEPWSVCDALRLEKDEQIAPEDLLKFLQPPEKMVPHLVCVVLPAVYEKPLTVGNAVTLTPTEASECFSSQFQSGIEYPKKILVNCGSVSFMSDLSVSKNLTFHIQPRKKIR